MSQNNLTIEDFYNWRAQQEVIYASEVRRGELLRLTVDLVGNHIVRHGSKLIINTSQPSLAIRAYNEA